MSDLPENDRMLDEAEFRAKVNEILGAVAVDEPEPDAQEEVEDIETDASEDATDESNQSYLTRERVIHREDADNKTTKTGVFSLSKHSVVVLGIVLLAVLLVFGLVKACTVSSANKGRVVTVEDYVAQADKLAAGYFYDEAIEHIKSYGEKYVNQPMLTDAITKYEELKSQLVEFDDMTEITHVFFHSLIADPTKAFDGDSRMDGYSDYMITVDEFKAILSQLYENNFILVDMRDIAYEKTDEAGNASFVYGKMSLPPDKKPIVISQDDVCYYEYMQTDGFASKLIIDENGMPKCEYTDADGNVSVGDYDMVPVMESFIAEHPGFSYRGARGILAVTGYEGVLGYRTCPTSDNYNEADVEKAKDVANKLKQMGWQFASHSWGHRRYGEVELETLKTDATKWEEQVRPIVGEETDILIFAHGDDLAGIEYYNDENERFTYLHSLGFRYFCNVDSSQYWVQKGKNYLRMGRRNIDGYRMYYDPELLDDLFDVASTWDQYRVFPIPAI